MRRKGGDGGLRSGGLVPVQRARRDRGRVGALACVLEALAKGEGGRDGGCNLHLLARLRVAPLPGSPLLGVEGPEPHERHLVAISNRLDDHVERGREDGAGHLLGDASAGRDGVNQVALGHRHPHRAPRSNVATPRSRRRPESLRAREERAEHRRQQPNHFRLSNEVRWLPCGAAASASIRRKECARCHEVEYCSVGCQKSDWKAHKKICGKGAAGGPVDRSLAALDLSGG
mmetsp:Transcript_2231/g.7220  ORF Transcript_2231/g.7220 Transcript_2231/m.7220 type:complete len:231 (+) Transcript_2231:1121-1813(+)